MSNWILFNTFVLALLALDLGYFNRHAHSIGRREAVAWTCFWIGVALCFGLGLYLWYDKQLALEYFTAYVIEKSLSIDNLFVILLIFKMHQIAPKHQHRVLFWGILGAIVFRGIMIFAGIELITRFDWMLYVFGLFLVYAGFSTYFDHLPPGEDAPENSLVRWINSKLPIKKDYGEGEKFFVREGGKFYVTPLFVALMFIEFADILFAVDSIPAVLAISQDPFIVYTSNIFAILGLRSLFFVIADWVPKFYYIHHALAAILVFVGCKMLLQGIYHVPTVFSLCFIIGVLVLAVVASIMRQKLTRT